jgi:hypothetical protein
MLALVVYSFTVSSSPWRPALVRVPWRSVEGQLPSFRVRRSRRKVELQGGQDRQRTCRDSAVHRAQGPEAQTFAEAVDPEGLERLGRHEVHLDCELERMLTMLRKLQKLRRAPNPTSKMGLGWVGHPLAWLQRPRKPRRADRCLRDAAGSARGAEKPVIRSAGLARLGPALTGADGVSLMS